MLVPTPHLAAATAFSAQSLVIRGPLMTGEAAGDARLAPAHTKFNRRVTNVRSGDRFRHRVDRSPNPPHAIGR